MARIPAPIRARLTRALRLLTERCWRLRESCYWAGTAAIALEELDHRPSYDLDFHTRRALVDTRPLLAEMRQTIPGGVEVLKAPDELGSGFRTTVQFGVDPVVTVEVLSNYDDVPDGHLVPSRLAPGMSRVTLERYLADKVQCVAERCEARDLFDIHAVLDRHPEHEALARRSLAAQDALLLVERLQAWTRDALESDLAAYPGVPVAAAEALRDRLLGWLKGQGNALET